MEPGGTIAGEVQGPLEPAGNETLPDLVITPADISFSDYSPEEGDTIFIYATVHNVGGSTANNVSVMLLDDMCEGCNDTYVVGADDVGDVPAGDVATASVPWNTSGQQGTNVVTAIADPQDVVAEVIESNNEASASIVVLPLGSLAIPDLVIIPSEITFSKNSPAEGEVIFIYAAVHNLGNETAYNVSVEFLDDVCQGCNATYLVGTDEAGTIPPGGVAGAATTWNTQGQGGTNVITVRADPQDIIPESNETNNVASKSIFVQPLGDQPPSVWVSVPNGWERWTGGTTHLISWVMLDDLDSSLYVQVSNRLDYALPWVLVTEGIHGVGQSTHQWSVPLANTTAAFVRVCVTDSSNSTTCDRSDSPFGIDSTRPSVLFTQPRDTAIGVPVTASLRIWFSELMDQASVESSFFSQPAISGIVFSWQASYGLLTVTHNPLQQNKTYVWGCSCQALDRSDPGNVLEGCPTSFSFSTVPDSNLTGADLTIDADDIWPVPPLPNYGDLVTLFAEVHNVGDVDAVNVTVHFSDNAMCMLDVVYEIGDGFLPLVPAQGSAIAYIVWDTTASADGYDLIWVAADAQSYVVETNELNNSAYRHIYVANTPCEMGFNPGNLALTSSNTCFSNGSPDPEDNVVVSAIVQNTGTSATYNVPVRFVDAFNGTEITIGDVVIPLIPVGASANTSVNWIASQEGTHRIKIIVDPANLIRETDESDNDVARWIGVGPMHRYGIMVDAWTLDDDGDGKYDDVAISVHDTLGHVVEGTSVCIDGVSFGPVAATGLLIAYDFAAGDHTVFVILPPFSSTAIFYSDG